MTVCMIAMLSSFYSDAQMTVYCSATGSAGSYITGYVTSTTKTDGSILVNTSNVSANVTRGYAVFNISALNIPATATITSVSLNIHFSLSGSPFSPTVYGLNSNLSTITSASTIFSNISNGTQLSSANWSSSSPVSIASNTSLINFIQSNYNSTISLGFAAPSASSNNAYTMTGETGTGGSSTATAPTLTITYTCTPSITMNANTGDTICSGNAVVFASSIINGGTTPGYQWKKNGTNISGATNPNYTTSSISNSDVFSCVLTSNAACATTNTATSNTQTMKVVSSAVPTVSISANPGSTICNGSAVTFSSTAVYGGGSPTYQWKKNGINITGATSSTYTTSTASNNDAFKCVVTSSLSCASPGTANSNSITMAVTPISLPTISISASNGNTICSGASVTFSSIITNGGPSPTYQWTKNGSIISGATSSSYTSSTISNGDIFRCILTSNLPCASPQIDSSNNIAMTVNPNLVPGISISSSGSTICSGSSVIFSSSISNGGTSPSYQWKKNGTNISGATSASYTNNTASNGDVFSCVLTSNATCVTSNTATSGNITMTVNANLAPSLNITASTGNTICSGTSVTFSSSATNGGTSPSYQWKKNGINIAGATSSSYTSNALINNDVITCVLTSSLPCPTPATVNSNSIAMTVNPIIIPTISVSANNGDTICSGNTVTFSTTITNGGNAPAYQWKKNGTNITGANNATYGTSMITNGNVFSCVLTSSATCAILANSNNATMTVVNSANPTVTISSSPGDTICSGSSVSFSSSAFYTGGTPSYQWKKNGINITGATNASYTTTFASNGDVYKCVITSSLSCANPATVNSNNKTMAVYTMATPTISINTAQGDTICTGNTVTFSSTITDGGSAPTYHWLKNGNLIAGANNNSYTSATISNGDLFVCILTSNRPCVSAAIDSSNSVTMTVNPLVTPTVSINANQGSNICEGAIVTFNSNASNAGSSASYKWYKNGTLVPGGINSVLTTGAILNGDVFNCILTSSATCASPATATSNDIAMTVNANVLPTVAISANPGTNISQGTNVSFSTYISNGGTNPSYKWFLNGNAIAGANNSSYSSGTLNNGDRISVTVTSSALCAQPASVSSNSDTIRFIATGITHVNGMDKDMSLYPNPTNGIFTISVSEKGTLYLYTRTGQTIYQIEIPEKTSVVNLPADLAKGVYFGKFISKQGTVSDIVRIIYQ